VMSPHGVKAARRVSITLNAAYRCVPRRRVVSYGYPCADPTGSFGAARSAHRMSQMGR